MSILENVEDYLQEREREKSKREIILDNLASTERLTKGMPDLCKVRLPREAQRMVKKESPVSLRKQGKKMVA